MNKNWSDLHENYKTQDWINKPSIFAETAITYFPTAGKILELGAGLGQDSRYFTELGYEVVSTDIQQAALNDAERKLPDTLREKIMFKQIDLRDQLPFSDGTFDVVYAHLSLHYFDHVTTVKLFNEIERILKPGGIFAFFTNSTDDPQYNTGTKIEEDYFMINETPKRFLSTKTAAAYAINFETILLDNSGETYKDSAKGIHNLIRFIGSKHFES